MRPVEAHLLRLLSHMPLLDRLEAVAVSGWSKGAVYQAVESLEAEGLAVSVPHATELTPATRRYCLTDMGLRRLAREEGVRVDGLLRSRPVSNQWRRLLMERLDAVAVVYRLASAISTLAHPLRFRWYRAMPMDAAVALPDGRVIAVVRQGPATDRTGFSKRLWRLREGTQPAATLLLMPDEARLRHARRLLAGAPSVAYLVLEGDAASAGAGASVWRTPSGAALLDLRTVLDHTGPRGPWPDEESPARASLPADLNAEAGEDWMLPTMLKPVEKRALDLLADWPWLTPRRPGRADGAEAVEALQGRRAADRPGPRRGHGHRGPPPRRHRPGAGCAGPQRPGLRGRGQEAVERRFHRPRIPLRVAQRLRQAEQAASQERRAHRRRPRLHCGPGEAGPLTLQGDRPARPAPQGLPLLPLRRRLRSIHPDAFGVLRRGDALWSFFLEWERRAVRPVTMAARLAPYLRYYSSHRPTDDHGARPDVLVVFDDDIAQTHFLRIAQGEMARTRVQVPLLVSHRELVEREGPLGRAWLAPGLTEPAHAFRSR